MPHISEVVRLYFALLCHERFVCAKEPSWNKIARERLKAAERNFRLAVKSFARARLTHHFLGKECFRGCLLGRKPIQLRDDRLVHEDFIVNEIERYLMGH